MERICSCCGQSVVIERNVGARVRFAVGLVGLVALLCLVPTLGFAMFMVSPIVGVAGLGISPLAREAFAPPICPACHRRFIEGAPAVKEERVELELRAAA